MFFVVSKIAGFLLAPSNALFLGAGGGFLLLASAWRVFGMALVLTAFLGIGIAGLSPLGNLLMRPLEERFPAPALNEPPDGVIVLGGSVSVDVSAARNMALVNESAERLFAVLTLARLYPEARLVFSGGYGRLGEAAASEAGIAASLLDAAGLEPGRLTLEDRSRNTAENAAFTREMVAPRPDETWLLVTSAYHMPRAVGVFRQAGFDVVAYTTDYRTRDDVGLEGFATIADGLKRTDLAVREWVGLAAYYFSGRTGALFPAP